MGNKPVTIGLKTDKTTYEAGSVITGTVYVKVKFNSSDRVTGIHLVLEGEEFTSVSKRETGALLTSLFAQHESQIDVENSQQRLDGPQGARRRKQPRSKVIQSNTRLLMVHVPLAQFPRALSSGEYEYPFKWELPPHLPASMYVATKGRSDCMVHYQLSAYFSTGTPNRGSGGGRQPSPNQQQQQQQEEQIIVQPHQIAKQKIQILTHPSPIQGLTAMHVEDEFSISTYGCFPKGQIDLGFHLDRTILSPGSAIQIQILGRNISKVPVTHLEVTLVEHIKWSAKKRSIKCSNTLAHETISTSDYPQWQSQTAASYPSNEALLHRDASPLTVRLWIPVSARASYAGKLVEITHTLVIRPVIHWLILSPTLERSVIIGSVVEGGETYVPESPPPPLAVSALTSADAALTGLGTSTTALSAAPMAEAELILPDDWRGQAADVIYIPPSSVLVDNGFARQLSVLPSAPDESLMDFNFQSNNNNSGDDERDGNQWQENVAPCDITELEAFLSTVKHMEELPILLSRNPSMLARVQIVTPRQFVNLVYHPDAAAQHHHHNTKHGGKKAMATTTAQKKKMTDDICRGRVLAAIMGESFQCRHVIACLWGCPEVYRMAILREMAPLASDLTTERGMIERELEPEEIDYVRNVLQWQ